MYEKCTCFNFPSRPIISADRACSYVRTLYSKAIPNLIEKTKRNKDLYNPEHNLT